MIIKNKKQIKEGKNTTFNLFTQYEEFIRELHLRASIKKPDLKKKLFNYLKKILIIIIGSFVTTFAFYILIDPNNIYNSGFNGLVQIITKLIIGKNNISWNNYHLIYYGLSLLSNLIIISFLYFFFVEKIEDLEIVSTSIFYTFFQFIWTKIFELFNFRSYVFDRLNPGSWKGLTSKTQFTLTLPYYLSIAFLASFIYAIGYVLILRTQGNTGGVSIITTYFSDKKKTKKFFIVETIKKYFAFFVIIVISIFNFYCNENDMQIKYRILEREWIKRTKKEVKFENVIKEWKKDIEEIINVKTNDSTRLSLRKKNQFISDFLEYETNCSNIEEYPQELDYFLSDNNKKIELFDKEIEKINKEIIVLKESSENKNRIKQKQIKKQNEKIQKRKLELEERKIKTIKKQEQNILKKLISEITNNERLWATVIFIFLSAYWTNQMFPYEEIISIEIHCNTEEERNRGLKILSKFSPLYYNAYKYDEKKQKEEIIYLINCKLSKWNYYLYLVDLEKIGKIHEIN